MTHASPCCATRSSRGVAHARNRGHRARGASLDRVPRRRRSLEPGQAPRAARSSPGGSTPTSPIPPGWRSRPSTAGCSTDAPAFSPEELERGIRSRNLVFAGSSNVMARTELLRRLGGFDESLHHIADWDLWIRLAEAGRPAACPEPLVAYIVHESNMHRTAIDTAMREGRLLRAKHAHSSLPGRFDPIVFRGWIAEGQAHSGRPGSRRDDLRRHGPAPPQPSRCAACGGRNAARARPPPRARGRGARRRRAGLAGDPPIAG